ncbi:MAG: hypothetical protein WD381_08440 [Balneolaceae bacterium]
MASWIWVLIPLVVIVGGYIIDYQKNKLKWQNQTNSNEAELEELRLITQQLKKRIENLEAIATDDVDHFQGSESNTLGRIEIDEQEEIKKKNINHVAGKASKKGEQQ